MDVSQNEMRKSLHLLVSSSALLELELASKYLVKVDSQELIPSYPACCIIGFNTVRRPIMYV